MTEAKANRLQLKMENAIGEYLQVKTSKTSTTGGTIVEVEFAGWKLSANSKTARFKVVLESGTKKVRNTFFLTKLPKPVA